MEDSQTPAFPERIVFVDDEPEVRRVVREALEHAVPGVILVTCSKGGELLNRLRELQPDLILLDLKMADMSGPDVLDALRKHPDGADIPVIFMTGAGVAMEENYEHLGVIGVIHKPFDTMRLHEEIGGMWRARTTDAPA